MPALAVVAVGAIGAMAAADAQRSAANTAADAAKNAAQIGVNADLEMFYKSLEQFRPLYEAGISSIPNLLAAPSGAQAPDLPSTTIDFTFDPEDKMYKIQQQEGEKSINRALAARGLYDSRVGINALGDFNQKLIAQSTQDQYGRAVEKYNRDYSQSIDKFNIENALAQQNLGKYQWLTQLGSGAAGATSAAANQTGGNILSAYNAMGTNQANAAVAAGQAQAGLYQDLGQVPANYLATEYYGQQAGLWS